MNLKKETFIRPNGRSLPVDDFREWDDPVIGEQDGYTASLIRNMSL